MKEFAYDIETSSWTWLLARRTDVAEIVAMAQQHFQFEVDGIFTPDPAFYAYHIDRAVVEQTHYQGKGQLIVARDKTTKKLRAYAWLARGGQTFYAQEELAEGRFIHVDLSLSSRDRVKLVSQVLDHWINWTRAVGIPVLCSSSIRGDQRAFMRLHEKKGFSVRGSLSYLRVKPLEKKL